MSAGWDDVRIHCERVRSVPSGMTAETPRETAASIRSRLQEHFVDGPEAAAQSQRSYHRWLVQASAAVRSGEEAPKVNTPTYRWMAFTKRQREACDLKKQQGRIECECNDVHDIDFTKIREHAKMNSPIVRRKTNDRGFDR